MVTGCYAELNPDAVSGMEGVEAVIKNIDKSKLINLFPYDNSAIASGLERPPGRSRFFLKVQDGCNGSCSYCVIPRARGGSRSIGPSVVIDGLRAAEGLYKEVVLTGIHLGQYGLDIGTRLSALIEEILAKTRFERIRLGSLEINEIDERLLELFESERLCRHLHIPLQSGDDKVLRLMNRNYNINYFVKAIDNIYKRMADASFGTDIIAGFPGEGEKEFANTLRVAKEAPFTYLHVFPYSRRPGTAAFGLPDSTEDKAKKERVAVLKDISDSKRLAYMLDNVGRRLEVLVERKVDGGLFIGTSGNYLKILIGGDGIERGSLVPVRVQRVENGLLYGNSDFEA